MAKSVYEKRHEADIEKLGELLAKYKKDYDLCDEGFEAFLSEANDVLTKKLPSPEKRRGGYLCINVDVKGFLVGSDGDPSYDDLGLIETTIGEAFDQLCKQGLLQTYDNINVDADLWER